MAQSNGAIERDDQPGLSGGYNNDDQKYHSCGGFRMRMRQAKPDRRKHGCKGGAEPLHVVVRLWFQLHGVSREMILAPRDDVSFAMEEERKCPAEFL